MIYDMSLNCVCVYEQQHLFNANNIQHHITGSGQIFSLVLLYCVQKTANNIPHVRAQFRLLYSNLYTSVETSGRMREEEPYDDNSNNEKTRPIFNEKD